MKKVVIRDNNECVFSARESRFSDICNCAMDGARCNGLCKCDKVKERLNGWNVLQK